MKFCCGITLYHPSMQELTFIKGYKNIFDKVYLFDNTPDIENIAIKNYFEDSENVVYMGNGINEGLSKGYNKMCSRALEDGYNYICLLDQDSIFTTENIKKVINYLLSDKTKEVAIYVPEIIYEHKINNIETRTECRGISLEWAISSGSFVNLNIYDETDGFDENYFIDRLDLDYCTTVKKMKYNLIKIEGAYLYQSLGEQRDGVLRRFSQHSPLRHYYIFRNRLYYFDKNNDNSLLSYLKITASSTKHILSVMLIENNKREKVRMMIKGLKDYNNENLGKIKHYERSDKFMC